MKKKDEIMPGLEAMLGNLLSEELISSLAQGVKEGMTETKTTEAGDASWCYVKDNKPVTSWMILRVNTSDCIFEFSKSVAQYKKKLDAFLKNLPEGQGVMFLPASFEIHTHGDQE